MYYKGECEPSGAKCLSVCTVHCAVNCLQLLFRVLLRHALIQKRFTNELNWRYEPLTAYLLDGAVTCIAAWLTVPVLKLLSDGGWHMSKKMAKVLHLSMTSRCKLHHAVHVSCRAYGVLPVSSTPYRLCWTVSMNSRFLRCACVCTFCVIFCGLKSQSHSDNGYNACNCSMFCMCIRSRSPPNVIPLVYPKGESLVHRQVATLHVLVIQNN